MPINPSIVDQGPRPKPGLQLSSLFSDNAVLQSGMSLPIWGWTEPCHLVRVELAGKTAVCRANSRGKFLLRLPALEAGGPFTLTAKDEDSGQVLTVKNVLLGEVWLASGQSNMEYAFGKYDPATATMKESELTVHDLQRREFFSTLKSQGKLRFFHVGHNFSGAGAEDPAGIWLDMADEHGAMLTAVGGWFGRHLQEQLDVPVGIIDSSLGGTEIQAWTSRNALDYGSCQQEIANHDSMYASEVIWTKGNEGNIPRVSKLAPSPEAFLKKGWADIDFPNIGWKSMEAPGSWKAHGIAGNGVVWFRQAIDLPKAWAGKKLTLRLGGIDKQDITYFNGVEVGRTGKDFETDFWNAKRQYAVPAKIAKAGKNVVAIRAYSFLMDGALGGRRNDYSLTLDETGETIILDATWSAKAECDWGHISFSGILEPGPGNSNTPGILFENMIAPLLPYAIKGVIWYQGENNANSLDEAQKYLDRLCLMIQDWRRHWGQGNFPFIVVQLAGYGAKTGNDQASIWPYVREAEQEVCNILPKVEVTTAIDVGDAVDIHPQDKKSVGMRLGNLALAKVYNKLKPELASCPTAVDTFRLGREVFVEFANCRAIRLRPGLDTALYLAGKDKKFYPADKVTMNGKRQIIVSCTKVRAPKYIQYAWSGCPTCTIYSSSGLPALPFRDFLVY